MKQFIAKILIFSVILSLGCLFIVAPTMAGMMPMNEEPTLQKDQADDSNCACCPAEKKETQPSK
ncbi:MAG: hypothetical protein HY602_00130, partial [Parcubacteria group bacterium]|nr:hypothetical protein [Parcubacteria group bacterium]